MLNTYFKVLKKMGWILEGLVASNDVDATGHNAGAAGRDSVEKKISEYLTWPSQLNCTPLGENRVKIGQI